MTADEQAEREHDRAANDERVRWDVLDWINPTDRQRDFLRAMRSHDYVLYGGAAGGGKSYVLRRALIYMLVDWFEKGLSNVRVGLFCETYPALHDRHLSRLRFEFPSDIGVYKESTHEFTLASRFGSGVIAFRNLDDPSKYLSAEFACIAVDELTRNPRSVYDFLRMRMRWPGVDRPKFLAASNPGGEGHAWVKQLWIDRDFPPEIAPLADKFAYVPAKASDNPHLPPGYYEMLKTLPGQLARAYAEGDWTIFAGQVFSEFRLETHVVKPFAIPSWWHVWLSNDAGLADPGTWGLFAASPEGQVFVVREWTFLNKTWYSDQARQVKKDLLAMGYDQQAIDRMTKVTGLDSFQGRMERGRSIVDVYRDAGLDGWVKPNVDGHPNRKARTGLLHEYLKPYDAGDRQEARLQIFDTCRELVRTLPTLTADENHPEEVKECDADHWYDYASYAITWWHARRSTAPEQEKYKPGTAGAILNHAAKMGEKKVTPRQKVFG